MWGSQLARSWLSVVKWPVNKLHRVQKKNRRPATFCSSQSILEQLQEKGFTKSNHSRSLVFTFNTRKRCGKWKCSKDESLTQTVSTKRFPEPVYEPWTMNAIGKMILQTGEQQKQELRLVHSRNRTGLRITQPQPLSVSDGNLLNIHNGVRNVCY